MSSSRKLQLSHLAKESNLKTSLEFCDSSKPSAPEADAMRSCHTRIMRLSDSLPAHSLLGLSLLGLTWNGVCLFFFKNLQGLLTSHHSQCAFLSLTF